MAERKTEMSGGGAGQSLTSQHHFNGASRLFRFTAFAAKAATARLRRTGIRAFLRDLPVLLQAGFIQYHRDSVAPEQSESGQSESGLRPRAFNIQSLLACPHCGSAVRVEAETHICVAGAHRGIAVAGVPHFHRAGAAPVLRMSEINQTHPYGTNALELLKRTGSGLVLDFGAGNTPDGCLLSNIVYMDVQQFRYTDVVVTTERLPFRDGTFDLVLSQAVFEHVENPHGAARELLRVLKPGGTVYIDTAFMQPLHADPCHYFNMTLHGIRKVFAGFEEVRSGVAPYQNPSFGWTMQLDQAMPGMAEGFWKDQLTILRQHLRERRWEFDEALGAKGREMLAAGYFFEGRKGV